ncbi:MAG: efflux RND transporter periplasmic adaptor subunit [Rhodothalassiaceae bacterium]
MATIPPLRHRAMIAGLVLLLGLLAALGFAGLRGRDDGDGTDGAARALPVSTTRVHLEKSYRMLRGFTGRVISRRRSDLGFELAGQLVAVLVDDGDRVEAGQVLARLDTARLDARRRELVAQRAEAQANRDLAEKTRARNAALFRDGHIAAQRLDEAEAQAAAARARVAALDASIAALDVDRAKAEIRAPFKGVIERRFIDEGTVVAAGTPVLRLVESDMLEAEVGLPLRFAQGLKRGDHLPLATVDHDILFARVKGIVPVVRGETRTALVTLSLAGSAAAGISDGALVTLEMEDRIDAEGFWIPVRALTADVRGLWRVYKVAQDDDGGGRVVFENVQILYSEDGRAFVSGTVSEGDLIIAGGVARVTPGRKVEVVSVDGAPSRVASGGGQ